MKGGCEMNKEVEKEVVEVVEDNGNEVISMQDKVLRIAVTIFVIAFIAAYVGMFILLFIYTLLCW